MEAPCEAWPSSDTSDRLRESQLQAQTARLGMRYKVLQNLVQTCHYLQGTRCQ